MAGVGIIFAIYFAITQGTSFFIPLVISAAITGAVSYIFFGFRLFGAADAKAFISLALLFPTQPLFMILSHRFPISEASGPAVFPFALIVLFNAAVLALVVPIYLFFRNLYCSGLKEFMGNASMSFVAYRVNIDKLSYIKFARLAYKYDEINGRLTRRRSMGGIALDKDTIQRLKAYHEEGNITTEVWVTPELPYMLFITIGFLTCCLLGI